MNNLLSIIFSILVLSGNLFAQTRTNQPVVSDQVEEAATTGGAQIEFESETIDYGTIEHNSDGVRQFRFTNTGTEPLVIKSAKGSCGCTVPTWPKEPINPGESGEIEVKYATNRVGSFRKTVTLTTNVEGASKVLTVKGNVLPAPPSPAPDSMDETQEE